MTSSDSTYKWPLQFNIVATAVAFSPSAKANLFESSRIAKMLNASMILIHVGYKTPTTEQKLNELISEVGIPNDMYTISWRSGDPTDAILNASKNDIEKLEKLLKTDPFRDTQNPLKEDAEFSKKNK